MGCRVVMGSLFPGVGGLTTVSANEIPPFTIVACGSCTVSLNARRGCVSYSLQWIHILPRELFQEQCVLSSNITLKSDMITT